MPIHILRDKDTVEWIVAFLAPGGPGIAFVQKGKLKATGKATIQGKKICLKDDFKSAKEKVAYMAAQFPIPGSGGELLIKALLPVQISRKLRSGGKPVILQTAVAQGLYKVKGKAFIFQPVAPVPVPKFDNAKEYKGFSKFKTTNKKVRGT
jgi:Contractile injection system spike tip protein